MQILLTDFHKECTKTSKENMYVEIELSEANPDIVESNSSYLKSKFLKFCCFSHPE